MIFDINDYTYRQNKNNFYIGDINLDENIKFKCDYIVIGNIKTSEMLIAVENLVVIGNIEAASVFINKDLFCTGTINSQSIDVDGENVILEQNIVTSYNELVIENEDVIKSLLHNNIKYYGYSEETIKVYKKEDNEYYIDLEIKESDMNIVFIGYINQVIKSISNEANNVNIYMDFNKNIKKIVSKLLNVEINNITVKESNNTINIKGSINDEGLNKESITIIEKLCKCVVIFTLDIDSKENDKSKVSQEIIIENLIQNINNVLSEKNEDESNIQINKKQIIFEYNDIHSCNLRKLESNIEKNKFQYIKYKEKIYINSTNILEILGLEKSYKPSKLVDFILVNYTNNKENNIVKFYNLTNYYKFIVEVAKSYKKLNVDANIIQELYTTLYNLNLKNKDMKESIPYWNNVVEGLKKHMTEEHIKQKIKISDEDFEEIKLGYTPPKNISKPLKRLYSEYNNDKNNESNNKENIIEKLIYSVMKKNKYDLNEIKICEIRHQEDKKYTVFIESKHHNSKTLNLISDKINNSNKDYVIELTHVNYSVVDA